ncbi:MAG: CsiV family protein, partial [Gammaproteobacteria bacterium]
IKHVAWRQPGLASEVALPVVIQDTIAAEIPEPGTTAGQPEPLLYTQARLDGIITISLARYLHFETTLRFEANGLTPPPTEQNAGFLTTDTLDTIKAGPSTVVYVDTQRRRMRSSELHYIDHPVIGMLVLMTPVELKN